MLGSLLGKVSDAGTPLAVRLWNGEQADAKQPRVTLALHEPSALKLLLKPRAGKLAEAYVEESIDVEGTARDRVGLGLSLGKTSVGEAQSKLLGGSHNRRSDRKAIEFHYGVSNDYCRTR